MIRVALQTELMGSTMQVAKTLYAHSSCRVLLRIEKTHACVSEHLYSMIMIAQAGDSTAA